MHHEVLGLDVGVSNFVIDYRSHLEEQKNLSLINPSDNPFLLSSENDFLVNNADLFNSFASSGNNNTFSNSTDDRNLAITFEGIYGYKIINAKRDPNSLFLSIPRFSAAFFTSSDTTSPFIRTNFILRNANISWDFHLQYLITLTIHVIRLILLSVLLLSIRRKQNHNHMRITTLKRRRILNMKLNKTSQIKRKILTFTSKLESFVSKLSFPMMSMLCLKQTASITANLANMLTL